MAAIGAKYRWHEGKILHAARLWKAPSMRRIPRILIEDRALEVGILLRLDEPWMVFEETEIPADSISQKDAIPLEFYQRRYHLLPEKIDDKDTYDWLKTSGNALLLWGNDNHYLVAPQKR